MKVGWIGWIGWIGPIKSGVSRTNLSNLLPVELIALRFPGPEILAGHPPSPLVGLLDPSTLPCLSWARIPRDFPNDFAYILR
jgi:hypothetical protein